MLQTHKIISDPFSTHMTSGRTLPWGPLPVVQSGAGQHGTEVVQKREDEEVRWG